MLPSVVQPGLEAPDRPRALIDDVELPPPVSIGEGSGFAALVASMLRCRRCSILLTDSEGFLTLEDAVGLPASARRMRIPMGRGIAGRVAAAGTPLVVGDETEALPDHTPSGAYRTASFLSVPFVLADGRIGVMNATERESGEAFGQADLDLLGRLASFFASSSYGQSARHEAALTAELRRTRELQIRIQEDERQRLARDLHDDAGHRILAAVLRLDVASQHCLESVSIRHELDEVRQLLTECADGLHEVAFGLRPQILTDLGLAAAIRSLTARLQGATGVCIRVLDGRLTQRPAEEVELAAFRIAQEALSNAVKYAQATLVKVSIRQTDDRFVLSVADNGVGFEPAVIDSSSRPRLGLRGMRERAELVGGSLDVRSRPGFGTSVRAQFPVSEVTS
ncbi:MAG TPA: GAF domain-containing sensor histidine kinase [Thermomicrobiales bacterium]|jgi:signal transduction histidine kinase|nr:GAF domain-containing sensor histidine kinase [Thermomicrobiales bacterium]